QKKNRPGRRAGLLEIKPEGRFVLGVELTVHGLSGVLMNLLGEVVKSEEISFGAKAGREEILNSLKKLVTSLLSFSPEVCRAGLGFVDPGLVDFKQGVSLYSTILPSWKNVPIKKLLEETYHLPVVLSNSEQAKAMAERWFGQARGVDDFVFIEYGEGIACGIFARGQPVRGGQSIAGELGHTRIMGEAIRCRCGRQGCLEALCCWPVLRTLREKGDRKKLEQRLQYLAVTIGNLANILNPSLIILDRNFLSLGETEAESLIRAIKEEILPEERSLLEVTVSKLGPQIGALGGAASVLEELFATGFELKTLPVKAQEEA
ncbi:MAG TPA: ROK family protein, partial [bacterium]|nr:ROK family protein [bacterium]